METSVDHQKIPIYDGIGLCSLYFGKSFSTPSCVNPQPSREQETDRLGRAERLNEVRVREHGLKASMEGTT